MTMNKIWFAAIAVAVASATLVQAQTVLPNADTCVLFSGPEPAREERLYSPISTEFDDDGWGTQYWYPAWRATNNCPETVRVNYKVSSFVPDEVYHCASMIIYPGEGVSHDSCKSLLDSSSRVVQVACFGGCNRERGHSAWSGPGPVFEDPRTADAAHPGSSGRGWHDDQETGSGVSPSGYGGLFARTDGRGGGEAFSDRPRAGRRVHAAKARRPPGSLSRGRGVRRSGFGDGRAACGG